MNRKTLARRYKDRYDGDSRGGHNRIFSQEEEQSFLKIRTKIQTNTETLNHAHIHVNSLEILDLRDDTVF